MGLLDWRRILFPGPKHPPIPNVCATNNDSLYFESLNRGGLCIGSSGTGKTEWAAKQIIDYAIEYPDRGILILDASGSLTRSLIRMVLLLPEPLRTQIYRRLILDIPGHPDYVTPFPFFHPKYGTDYEEQSQRVTKNYETLYSEIIERTPIMALAIRETLPQLCRLLTAMQNDSGDPSQITEAKKLILDAKALRKAVKKYGHLVPEARWYFLEDYLKHVTPHERELRSYALRSVLGNVEPRTMRARFGYPYPLWTSKEIDEEGLICIVNGEEIINQEKSQAIVFTDVFSQFFAHINTRVPHDQKNKPILLVIDEVPMLLRIKGFASEIARVSPQYRSRNCQIFVIFQALWQLAENLKDQIWSLGNVTCFLVDDFDEAYRISQQLFNYDPSSGKQLPDTELLLAETDRGQYLRDDNWLQHLKHRECVIKRYVTEAQEEEYVAYIQRTTDNPQEISDESIQVMKEILLKRRAIPIKEALSVVNQEEPIKRPTIS